VTGRCLVVHPGALGDVLLAGPALAHLRLLGFRTTLAVASRLAALFRGSGLVDDARDLESLGLHRVFVDGVDPGALESLASFDALVCWLGAGDPTFRANLASVGRPAVIARAAPPADAGRHASRHLVETLAPLGPVPSRLPLVRLGVTTAGRAMAGGWLAARGIGPAEAVVLQPGAGSAVKAWPGFSALTRRLRDADLPVIALAGPADGPAVEALLGTGVVAVERLARDWPLPEVAALLSLARAAVGNDSGPTHLAAAVGCPTVAVFGPSDPALWAPLGPHVRVVAGRPGAPWVDVDSVEAALRAILAAPAAGATAEAARAGSGQAWP
jgi:ADP-heptose:LPS heptosyltransferase